MSETNELTPPPLPTQNSSPPPEAPARLEPLAPWWHTALLVLIVVVVSWFGANRDRSRITGDVRILLYLQTIVWLWLLTAYVYWGVRKRTTIRELVGGTWNSAEDFLLQVLAAAGFWISAALVLAALAYSFGFADPKQAAEAQKQIAFLVPQNARELGVWVAVCISAGFCEEVVFRGYLQRQLGAWTGRAFVGAVLSAMLFGAGHGYEGGKRMVLIAVFGLLFGLLVLVQKHLRSAMMAHAWHNFFVGVAPFFVEQLRNPK